MPIGDYYHWVQIKRPSSWKKIIPFLFSLFASITLTLGILPSIAESAGHLIPNKCAAYAWYQYSSMHENDVVRRIENTPGECVNYFFYTARLENETVRKFYGVRVMNRAYYQLDAYLENWDGTANSTKIFSLLEYLRSYKYTLFNNPKFVTSIPKSLERKIANLFSSFWRYFVFRLPSNYENMIKNPQQREILLSFLNGIGNYNSTTYVDLDWFTEFIKMFNYDVYSGYTGHNQKYFSRSILFNIGSTLWYDSNVMKKLVDLPGFRDSYIKLSDAATNFTLNNFDNFKKENIVGIPIEMEVLAIREPLSVFEKLPKSAQKKFLTIFRRYSSNSSPSHRELVYAELAHRIMMKDSPELCAQFDRDVCSSSTIDKILRSVFPKTYNCSSALATLYFSSVTTYDEGIKFCNELYRTSRAFQKFFNVTLDDTVDDTKPTHKANIYIYTNYPERSYFDYSLFSTTDTYGGLTIVPRDGLGPTHIHVSKSDPLWAHYDKTRIYNGIHEYTHFLDDMLIRKGIFGDIKNSQKILWYIEGIAEYFSHDVIYGDNGESSYYLPSLEEAYELVTNDGESLYTTFNDHDYDDNTYPLGYAAVRYMIDRHKQVLLDMVEKLKTGDRDGFTRQALEIAPLYNRNFKDWLAVKTGH